MAPARPDSLADGTAAGDLRIAHVSSGVLVGGRGGSPRCPGPGRLSTWLTVFGGRRSCTLDLWPTRRGPAPFSFRGSLGLSGPSLSLGLGSCVIRFFAAVGKDFAFWAPTVEEQQAFLNQ